MKDLSRLIQMSNTNMSQASDHARTHKNNYKMVQFKFLETLKYKAREKS